MRRKRVCFVTGTRAEFGLMRSTLRAIADHPGLQLQIIVTGMHLNRSRGNSIAQIKKDGWKIDRVITWPALDSRLETARSTGLALANLARAFVALKSDIVLVVGDRVEAFAAASAAHLVGSVVAHVHGGDRALGQVDDSLRHAITKLAHLHFPATAHSAARIKKLGEAAHRIHVAGTPGLDEILPLAERGSRPSGVAPPFALLVVHPVDADDRTEYSRAKTILQAVKSFDFERVIIVHPNNDPGSSGIVRCWKRHARGPRFRVHADLPRSQFLGLLRDAAVLVGNSSSGIIEAASFGTPVVDIGPRQLGRERSGNVTNVPYDSVQIRRALGQIWNGGQPRRFRGKNAYGRGGAGAKIARILASIRLDDHTRRKLIAY